MNDFGFSIRAAALGVDAGCWLPLIYFLKMKQRCNTGGNRAHPHDQEKSSGNSEADEVRVGGSSFYKGMLGDAIQPLLPGKSGLGFQPRPGALSMLGLRERVLGQQLCGNGAKVKLGPKQEWVTPAFWVTEVMWKLVLHLGKGPTSK